MNRLFGRGKPKEPPPNLNDVIQGVSYQFNIWSVCLGYVNYVVMQGSEQFW